MQIKNTAEGTAHEKNTSPKNTTITLYGTINISSYNVATEILLTPILPGTGEECSM